MTPPELFDAVDSVTAGRRHRWPHGRQPVLWLTSETVTIGTRTWTAGHTARRDGHDAHGFTVRQCAQMRAALLPVLASYGTPLEAYTRHLC